MVGGEDYEHHNWRAFAVRQSASFGYRRVEMSLLLWEISGAKGSGGLFFFTLASSSATIFLKSCFSQLLTELGPVGKLGDELFVDG